MNIPTKSHTRSAAARVFSWVLAFALVFSLASAASADEGTYSAEVVVSANGADISGKLILDTNQVLLGVLASMASQGETVLSAAAYLGPQALAVESNLLNGAYGLDLTAIAQNLPGSIFDPSSGSQYALDWDSYGQIMDMLNGNLMETVLSPAMNSGAMLEAMNVLAEAYSETLQQISIMPTVASSMASVVIDGKPSQVQQIRATVDAETACAITGKLVEPLMNNPQAQQALATVIDEAAAAAQNDLGATGEEIVRMLVQELPGELDNARQELVDAGYTVSVVACLDPDTQMPVKLSLEISYYGSTVINLLMNEELSFFRLELVGDGKVREAAEFRILENSEKSLSCSLALFEEDEDIASVRFDLNKAGKAFLVSITAEEETHTVSGFYTLSENLFSVTVDKLDGQDMGGSVTLNLRFDDSITLPSFTEVLTMSEEEFSLLVELVTETAETVSQMVG